MTHQLRKTLTERPLKLNSCGHQVGLSVPSFDQEELTLDTTSSLPSEPQEPQVNDMAVTSGVTNCGVNDKIRICWSPSQTKMIYI